MDFKILEKASETLQDKLRLDETASDLAEQFSFRSNVGSHRYYIEPYKAQWGPMMEYGSFIPLPKRVLDQYTKIECASFMGTIPELDRVWVTVDNKLFLWKYTTSNTTGPASPELHQDGEISSDDCEVYDGISEVIVSVALSAPKPGVFLDAVKYVLVVASPVEVVLLAVTCDEQGSNFKLVPTAYTMPSDNVAMVKVVGSQVGRIFMAGNDGNVYELDYTNSESVWSALLDGGDENARHKCRKINHFAWNWRLVHLLPPFLKSFAAEEDSLVDLAVDNVRQVVYSVTAKGVLSAFYLGPAGAETHLFLSAFNILDAARNFLTSSNGSVAEGSPKPESFSNTASAGFNVLSLHVLPLTESKKAHVVAVLGNGIRIYLSVVAGSTFFNNLPGPQQQSGSYTMPTGICVGCVRSPPSPATLRVSSNSSGRVSGASTTDGLNGAVDVENGSVPSYISSQALKVSSSLYSQGVTMLALDKQQHPDELVCLFEDLVGRTHLTLGLPPAYQPPCMREGVCIGLDETTSGGKIYAIKENCSQIHFPEVARLRAMFAQSATPHNAAIRDSSHHFDISSDSRAVIGAAKSGLGWLSGRDDEDSRAAFTPVSDAPVVFGADALAMAAKPSGTGYDRYDLNQVALLSEMSWQHIPCSSVSLQRQFLVLTNQGIHTLRKLRPADVLHRHLSQVNNLADEQCRIFFSSFGALEASAMCVALACGLPCDAGSSSSALSQSAVLRRPLETIQMRAMSVMLGLTQGPTYKIVGSSVTPAGMKDSRLMLTDSSHEFVRSSAHEALYLVASRILRPLWLRAVVERSRRASSLWTVQLIADVRAPLVELQKLIQGFFSTAVADSKQQQDYLASLSSKVSEDMVTRQMLDHAQQNVNAERVLQLQAKSLEDASINALHRLVTKALQALAFIEVLLSVSKKWKLEVQWALLGEITFKALVVSPRVHQNVKKLVTALINDLNRSNNLNVVDQVIDWLTRECSFYFTHGDRCAYEAAKLLSSIQKQVKSGSGLVAGSRLWQELQDQSRQCTLLLLGSAQYWRSVDAVRGENSELWLKCTALLELEQAGRDGVVDLCLAAANNFAIAPGGTATVGTHSSGEVFSPSRTGTDFSSTQDTAVSGDNLWRQHLYRDSAELSEVDRLVGEEACFQCLVQHILTVGTDVRRLGAGILPTTLPSGENGDPLEIAQAAMYKMIVRAVAGSSNMIFHTLLGERLLRDHQDVLLSVRSIFIEEYLSGKDSQLLYSYYHRHGEFVKATTLMSGLARSEENVEIGVRLAHLHKAVASAEKAVACSASAAECQLMSETLLDLKDTLDIAVYQQQALTRLSEEFSGYNYSSASGRARYSEGQRRSLDLMERAVQRSRFHLLPITDLFHDICLPYKLWDLCLLILHVSKHEDSELVVKLWRSLIFRVVPEEGGCEESRVFLSLKRDPSRVEIDKRHQQTVAKFESSAQWLPSLELLVVQLAQQLLQSAEPGQGVSVGAAAFPSTLVLEELEEIAATLSVCDTEIGEETRTRNWATRCFYEVGFSHGTLVELYVEIFDRWAGKAPEKLLHILSATVNVLLLWTRAAAELSVRNEVGTRQLIQAARSGRLNGWIEKLRRHLSTLGARKLSPTGSEQLARAGKELAEVNRRVSEITLA